MRGRTHCPVLCIIVRQKVRRESGCSADQGLRRNGNDRDAVGNASHIKRDDM